MGTVLDAVSTIVSVMDAHPCLVIPKVIPPLSISSSTVKEGALVSIWTESGCLIVFLAVDVCTIVEGIVSPTNRTPSLLILEVPVETGEGSVLLALVLQK